MKKNKILPLILTMILTACAAPAAVGSTAAQPAVPSVETQTQSAQTTAPSELTAPSEPAAQPDDTPTETTSGAAGGFTLASPAVDASGLLPITYTCDGESISPPVEWSGAPEGTQSFALIMHHVAAPDDVHWYWVLYNLPVSTTSLPENASGIGALGTNSVNGRNEYAPPCSKGPGEKIYTLTLYALSAQPELSLAASQIDRDALLEAIQGITLESVELKVRYTRNMETK